MGKSQVTVSFGGNLSPKSWWCWNSRGRINPAACYIQRFRKIIGSHLLMTLSSIETDAREIPDIVRGMSQRPGGRTISQQLSFRGLSLHVGFCFQHTHTHTPQWHCDVYPPVSTQQTCKNEEEQRLVVTVACGNYLGKWLGWFFFLGGGKGVIENKLEEEQSKNRRHHLYLQNWSSGEGESHGLLVSNPGWAWEWFPQFCGSATHAGCP